jgi:hypothetical protein
MTISCAVPRTARIHQRMAWFAAPSLVTTGSAVVGGLIDAS